MSLELETIGKLVKKFTTEGTSKAGKPWNKLTFVLQIEGNYEKIQSFDVFNKDDLKMFINDTSLETVLKVSFNFESREYDGRYFHNINAWKAEVHRSEEYAAPKQADNIYQPTPPDADDPLPF